MNLNTHNETVILGLLSQLKQEHDKGNIICVRQMNTVELMNVTAKFNFDGDGIIQIPGFSTDKNYVEAEIEWYESGSTKADYISNFASLWSDVEDKEGYVNSNYGYLVFSPQNGNQFYNVIEVLKEDPMSRRAIMYYTNPFMHSMGGKDHVCTMYVSYTMRSDKLQAFVSMRSSDLRFGVVGADLAWQIYMLKKVAVAMNVEPGEINWHAVSLHLYEKHWDIFETLN